MSQQPVLPSQIRQALQLRHSFWASGVLVCGVLSGCSTPSLTSHLPPSRTRHVAAHVPTASRAPRTDESTVTFPSQVVPASAGISNDVAHSHPPSGVVTVAAEGEGPSVGRASIGGGGRGELTRGSFARRLQLPPDLPGAESPPAVLPPADDPQARARAVENLFPPLGPLPVLSPAMPPTGVRYSLPELEARTLAIAPAVDQAANAVIAADGIAWQAGRPFNPQVGYEADTVRTLGTAGYQGVYVEQVFQTAGKRQLAQQVACYDITTAEFGLR
ncbi:MAG: hypothetical protein ACK50P_17310 [Planctomycetaceae bacterium]